jgi:hypothetical protein
MIVRPSNPQIEKNEKTYLSADAVAGDTTLTIQNTEGITALDYFVIGKMGTEQTELVQIATVTGNNTITTGALKFNHSIDTPLSFIRYNKYQVHRASSKTGTYTQLGTNQDIEVDQEFSEYEDTSGASTNWYKIRFYNTQTNSYSDYSDVIQGTGYTDDSVQAIMDRIYIIGNDTGRKVISEDEMMIVLNDGYRIAISKVMSEDPDFYRKRGYLDVVNSYDTGTVAVTDGGTTVTGTGTTWTAAMVGRKILFGQEGYPYLIDTVTPGTGLTLVRAYNGAGTNLTASSYTIFQDEYDVYDDSDGTNILTSIRKIRKVTDEDGTIVEPFDTSRTESGWSLKRVGDSIKFCLNFILGTNDGAGRWTVDYIYQPGKLDSSADTPELPVGFDGALQAYGLMRLKEHMGENADKYTSEFQSEINNMVRRGTNRTGKPKSFRLANSQPRPIIRNADWMIDKTEN